MFSLLPFVLSVQLGILPVEMWSTIFRYLDPKSLLAGARSHKLWLNVCHGDPVLRRRLHIALKEEKSYLHNMIVNPRMLTSVSREFPSREYGVNVQKSISKRDIYFSAFSEKRPALNCTKICDSGKRTNKMHYKKRFSPYRI
ncbi:hypothetical protein NQ314_004395 [Rhamnusium bicolor]|uniref:F-box domain-containing protein n=1 Tax=Rhamnusium bicolor TaxID=1586634 RepID=A0AAV8ZM40_9CUCU|nr:hypothetical protein NQ314_004395 [Rhamnusium bicolor]